jgi:hypothetical protein
LSDWHATIWAEYLMYSLVLSSTPVPKALAELRQWRSEPVLARVVNSYAGMMAESTLLLWAGRQEEARRLFETGSRLAIEVGTPTALAVAGQTAHRAPCLPDDRLVVILEESLRVLEDSGNAGWIAPAAAYLGDIRLRLGDVAAARALAERARDVALPEDVAVQCDWRVLATRLALAEGRNADAMAVAGAAVLWAMRCESLDVRIPAREARAAVRAAVGDVTGAISDLSDAISEAEAKGAVFFSTRLARHRDRLAERSATRRS